MSAAFPKRYFDAMGLISLLDTRGDCSLVREPPYADSDRIAEISCRQHVVLADAVALRFLSLKETKPS